MNRAKKKKTAAATVLREPFLGLFLPYQQEWLGDRRQFKIGLWARQTGKDYTCAAEAALDCMVEKQKHWLILACGERQAIESLEKARDWVRIISTPGGHGNLFHKLWMQSSPEGQLFGRHKVTIHDATAQKLPINIAQLKAGMVDPEAWSQEYECEFVDQSSILLPYTLIEQCESPEATETANDLSRAVGEIFIGIDFGRKHDFTACWVLERVGKELWTREVLTLDGLPTPAQVERLAPLVQHARRVCLDYTGAGVGLGDLLVERFSAAPHGKVELCHFTAHLKRELFPKVRAALEGQKVWLPSSAAIREDLHSVHRVVSLSGNSYRASHRADGHSDRCTALALALRASESTPLVAAASNVGRRFAYLRGR